IRSNQRPGVAIITSHRIANINLVLCAEWNPHRGKQHCDCRSSQETFHFTILSVRSVFALFRFSLPACSPCLPATVSNYKSLLEAKKGAARLYDFDPEIPS